VKKKPVDEVEEKDQEVVIEGSEMQAIQGGLFSLYGKNKYLSEGFSFG
jgi:hypothetical protein